MFAYNRQLESLTRVLHTPATPRWLAQLEQGIAEYAGLRGGSAQHPGFALFAATTWRAFIQDWHSQFSSVFEQLTPLPDQPGPYTEAKDIATAKQILAEIARLRTYLLPKP